MLRNLSRHYRQEKDAKTAKGDNDKMYNNYAICYQKLAHSAGKAITANNQSQGMIE